jgi:hypothetical protein
MPERACLAASSRLSTGEVSVPCVSEFWARFNPVDVGALSIARYVEPASLLLAEIAYNGSGGPQLAYRFQYLPKRRK